MPTGQTWHSDFFLVVHFGQLTRTLCFTNDALNVAFVCLLFLIPLLAIRPVLRLRRWFKAAATIFLVPLPAVSLSCQDLQAQTFQLR
jgi:hypothetical protein